MGRTLLSYAYDLDGNKISRRDVTGKETAYTYNRDGLLTAVLEGGKTLAAYTYHADGNVERLCIGTSLTTQYDYDIDRNLQGIRTMDGTTVLTESTFSYDGNANRTEKKGLEGLTRYSYDANNRLIEVQYPHIIGSLKDGNTAFEKLSYDKAGNRIQRVTESLTEQYHYDNCNRLTRLDTTPTDLNKPQTIKCYLYDKQGNMLSDGSNTYSYDGFNRVAEVRTAEGNVQKNHYDAEGLRHEMEENGKLVKFLYNENREVEAEEEASGNIIRYVRGLGLISSDSESARTYYHYVCDEQGSVTHVLEGESGAVLNRYTYDAFGNTIDCEEQVHNRFRYNGEQYDPVTSQYYLRARFYNPAIARFTQEDTYYGDGLNLYQYCANNPVVYKDPSGHDLCPTQIDLYRRYREEGMTAAQAFNRMRDDLGLPRGENGIPAGVAYEGPLYRNIGCLPDGTPINPLEISDFTNERNYRYTQNGVNGLYFASSQHVMEGEMSSYGSNPYAVDRTTYYYHQVSLNNMLDLTNPDTRRMLNVSLEDLISEEYKAYNSSQPSPATTHVMGRYANDNGYTGMVVPSARADGGVNIVIFNPESIDFGVYTTIHERQ